MAAIGATVRGERQLERREFIDYAIAVLGAEAGLYVEGRTITKTETRPRTGVIAWLRNRLPYVTDANPVTVEVEVNEPALSTREIQLMLTYVHNRPGRLG